MFKDRKPKVEIRLNFNSVTRCFFAQNVNEMQTNMH